MIRDGKQKGFTLIEMAIVLVILGFLFAAFMLPLRVQREQALRNQTQTTLDDAKQAIIGYVQAKGHLPCPATSDGTGIFPDDRPLTNPINDGICTKTTGFLPAASLGLQTTDAQGFALDAWNNRIRYAVTQIDNPNGVSGGLPAGYGVKGVPDFTSSSELQDIGISRTNPSPPNYTLALNPDLKVSCGQIETVDCKPANFMTDNAVVVIYSTGANGALPNADMGADEVANKQATTTFYMRTATAKGTAQGEFDDMVLWISPFTLYNAMIQAGQLR